MVVLPDGDAGLRTDALLALVAWLADATGVAPAVVWWQHGPAVGPVPGTSAVIDAGAVNDQLVPRSLAAAGLRPLARRVKSVRLRRLLAPLADADAVLLGSPAMAAFLEWVPTEGQRRVAVWCGDGEAFDPRALPAPDATAVHVGSGPSDEPAVTGAERFGNGTGPSGLVLHPTRVAEALGVTVPSTRAADRLTVVERRPRGDEPLPAAVLAAIAPSPAPPVEAAAGPAPAESGPPPDHEPAPDAEVPILDAAARPVDPLAADLVNIWAELLDRRDIPTDVGFFDLGGHSLLAARMLVLLERRTGVRLPMSVFLEATTVDALAAAARANEPDGDPILVPLVSGDPSRPPLFVTHDLQGSAFRFRALAEAAVDPGRPAYGFESPFLEGRCAFTTIAAMAERYVRAVRSVQAGGPYHLAGYSFGGILAFEMARLLRGEGETVEVLGIVDVGPGYRGLDYSRTDAPPLPYLDAALEAAGPLPAWARPVRRLWTNPRVLSARWHRLLARGEAVPPEERLWFAWWSHWHLVGPQWAPAAYDGRIDLFWAETTVGTDATMGWGVTGAEVAVHPIPGRHEDLLRSPSLDTIGAVLRARLGAATTPR